MVGMSGGVDSSVAAALLMEQGYEVAGVTLRLWEESDADAKRVAEALGIPHYTYDLRDEFRRSVVDYFIREYQNGRTPNPCIACNRHIKFGMMLDYAFDKGYDGVATGHYARIIWENGRYRLMESHNRKKDQSYVLYHLTQQQLAHILFPVDSLSKEQVRLIAQEKQLPVAQKSESQDICFIKNQSYTDFIERYTGKSFPAGDFIDRDGKVVGRHKGIIYYTVGQRKGLGGTFGRPMYVTAINPEDNTITLGETGDEYADSLIAGDLHFIDGEMPSCFTADVMVRYRSRRYAGQIKLLGDFTAKVKFKEPPRAVTQGQAAGFYDGTTVLGGGTIE